MGKKGKCPEFENHERWLVSYADMLTLLFAVFVVLFALKEGGEPQVQQTAGSMQESFNTPLEDIPIERRQGPIEQGYGIFEHFQGDQIMAPMIQKFPSKKRSIKIIDDEMNRVKVQLEERLYGPQQFRSDDKPGFERIVDVERTTKGFKLKLMARQFFKPGEIKLETKGLKSLDDIALILKPLGREVTIEGHTDSTLPPGNFSNWELSALRATGILRYFVKTHGFPQAKIGAAGYGDARPIAHNGTETGRHLNRRIEILVHYEDENQTEL